MKLAAIVLVTLFSLTAQADPGHFKGKQRALVLLLEWSNQASRHAAKEIDTTFFALGTSSLRDFFLENSVGRFDLTGDVMDWRRTTARWNPQGSCDLNPIVREAWATFGHDVKIADYDLDGNGKIDNLFVVHSGRINQDRVGPECTFTTFSRADHAIVFQSEGSAKSVRASPSASIFTKPAMGISDCPTCIATITTANTASACGA